MAKITIEFNADATASEFCELVREIKKVFVNNTNIMKIEVS